MRTKKELRRLLREQKSMNRITDSVLLEAIKEIRYWQYHGIVSLSETTIVNYAYDIERNGGCK